MAKILWAFGISLLLFFSATGVLEAFRQHAKISAARPLEVTILSGKVETHVSVGPSRRPGTLPSWSP